MSEDWRNVLSSSGKPTAWNIPAATITALVEPGAVATSGKPSATRLTAEVYILSAPPQTPADLPNSFFTRRYKDLLELPPKPPAKPAT
jgi:hypothetical protein